MKIRPSHDRRGGTLQRSNVEVLLSTLALIGGFMLLVSCGPLPPIPEIAPPMPPVDEGAQLEYWDDLGCFPKDCDLPPGMKELCQAFAAGTIAWPGDCVVMPGEACQALCAQEKAASGLDLPTTVIDGYQIGWMQPIQIDDNIADGGRPQFGWGLVDPVVDHDGRVLLVYGGLVEGSSRYYRYWDGEFLSEPAVWNGPKNNQKRVFDSQNILHIISIENLGQADQYLAHTTWDGKTFTSEALFPGRFVQPELLNNNLAIDGQDRLHLTFWDKSLGVWQVWYTRYDENGWYEPVGLSDSVTDSRNPSLDVLDDGRVFIDWTDVLDYILVETTTTPTMFTWFDGEKWATPDESGLGFGPVLVDSQGIVHTVGEAVYSYWDGEAWSQPTQIDYPGQATAMYHAILDPFDNLHVIWNRFNQLDTPTTDGRQMSREMMYRRRNADGTWTPVATLGVWDTSPTYKEVHVMLAVDDAGVVHAAFWGNIEGAERQYYFNNSAPVQDASLLDLEVMPPQPAFKQYTFPEPEPVAAVPPEDWGAVDVLELEGGQAANMDLASDSTGHLHVVWQQPVGDNYEIMYRSYDGSAWSQVANLSNSPSVDFDPVIAIDAADGIHVGWIGSIPGSTGTFHTSFDGNAWSPPEKLSKVMTWWGLSSMIKVSATKENTTRPTIAAGTFGEAAMAWEHISEGFSNAIAVVMRDESGWDPEAFPNEDSHFTYAGERAALDFDPQGNLHLVYTYSGTMEGLDAGVYLKGQPIYTRYDGAAWIEPVPLLPIPANPNPGDQWGFMTSVGAAGPDSVLVAFNMRPFEREYAPYRLSTDNSNVYLTYWDGRYWSDARRIDGGTAYGPTHVDVAMDSAGLAHVVWSKYDTYNKRYSIYYTTSDGTQESEIVLIWQSGIHNDPYPILKPSIVVGGGGEVTIAFEYAEGDVYKAYFTSKR